MTRGRPMLVAVFVVVLAMLTTACGRQGSEDAPEPEVREDSEDDVAADAPGEPLGIVVTTSILGDVVGNIVGDDGEVHVIMQPGADPHQFQPSAVDGARLRDADLVVANGLDLEENLVSALHAAAEEGVRVFELADHLDPIEFAFDGPHGHEDEHGNEEEHAHDDHAHGPYDPHVWFDPVRMADGVHLIATEIAEVATGVDTSALEERAEAYARQVLAVHEELEEILWAVPAERRVLVTNHDALGYLAHRYDFEVLGTIIPGSSTQAEADPRSFAELVEAVERAGVPAVFAENTDSTRLAEQLASEVVGRSDLEVEVVRLYTDALAEPGSGAETYLGLLRTTAQRIADALA